MRRSSIGNAASRLYRNGATRNAAEAAFMPRSKPASMAKTLRPPEAPTIVDLRRRVKVWRATALAASALAATLLVTVGVREFQPRPKQQNLVAVLQKDATSPAFLVTVNVENAL